MRTGWTGYVSEVIAHGGSHGEQVSEGASPAKVVEKHPMSEAIAPQNQLSLPRQRQVPFGLGEALLFIVLFFPCILYMLRKNLRISQ